MAAIVSSEHAAQSPSGAMSPASALRIAWVSYLVMLAAPFFLFLYVMWTLNHATAPTDRLGNNDWFLGAMGYMLVALPCAFFYRSHVFKAYWQGDVVAPAHYLKGMLAFWLALEIGGIISLLGCLMSGRMMPCLVPAAVAFVFFTPFWPSGRAMTRHVGNTDDPSTYEEPR